MGGCKDNINQVPDKVNNISTREIEVFNTKESNITELEIMEGCSEYDISISDDDSLSINAELEIWKGNDKVKKRKIETLYILTNFPEKNKLVTEETANGKVEENYIQTMEILRLIILMQNFYLCYINKQRCTIIICRSRGIDTYGIL